MAKKLATILLVLGAAGCRMCSDCCDYSSPVPGGLPMSASRAGSNLGASQYLSDPTYVEPPVPMPAVVDGAEPMITP
jgi:hypothetical protein